MLAAVRAAGRRSVALRDIAVRVGATRSIRRSAGVEGNFFRSVTQLATPLGLATTLTVATTVATMTPELQEKSAVMLDYELAVKMTCEGCASAVRKALESCAEVSAVDIDLEKEIVVVTSSLRGDEIVAKLEEAGREARLIGSGASTQDQVAQVQVPEHVGSAEENTSCIAEFKGEAFGHGPVMGVVRLIQKTNSTAVLQGALGGLKPNSPYSVVVHKYGDLRKGKEGPIYAGSDATEEEGASDPVGVLLTASTKDDGSLELSGQNQVIVWDIIGRALHIHEGTSTGESLAGSVIARSSSVGANHKKVCACDGTVIWEASNVI
mmetsp:Transcript_6159/g.10940  ORF Transcript_6159/g.10940 Transcript_6159/m.10940 type:complete len:323 (-) Transcript_6159:134-1102(-)